MRWDRAVGFVGTSDGCNARALPEGDLTPRMTFLTQRNGLIATEHKAGSADRSSGPCTFFAGAFESGASSLTDPYAFLFSDSSGNRNDGIAEHAGRIEVLFDDLRALGFTVLVKLAALIVCSLPLSPFGIIIVAPCCVSAGN